MGSPAAVGEVIADFSALTPTLSQGEREVNASADEHGVAVAEEPEAAPYRLAVGLEHELFAGESAH
ncbi:hypothetical protein GMPD_21120 [Geomonas paludis]|uniref:Uncharacterized protein n=1 Tax=Geomonas paludis TaxID=2740185 RepID=A0A6V8MXC9_9BACT|nr:hypothetical protein GMPD_21120 [Geomonas paludis]